MSNTLLFVFDIDGTLTDYNKYIKDIAIPYFQKKYNLKVINQNALEIEDIFDIKASYIAEGLSEEHAQNKETVLLNKYWISYRFIYFALLVKYRRHCVSFLKWLRKNGFSVQIHSSRAKCTDQNIVGSIARKFTILQCWKNGLLLEPSNFFFYKDDNAKTNGIISAKPLIAFDDKPEIISRLNAASIPTCCISGTHNSVCCDTKLNVVISSYEQTYLENRITALLGKRKWEYSSREARSQRFFNKISWLDIVLKSIFHPIILNMSNFSNVDTGIIYAPNHIRTVDPLVIEGIIKTNVHWVALKRFFDGTDSIFNNSKNPLLCSVTKYLFTSLDYFPVERKSDNEHARNFRSITDMSMFLRYGYKIGIFPEGTTRKNGTDFFGTFDNGFIELAKRNNARIQPILIYWTKQKKSIPIVNFGKIISPVGRDTNEILEQYKESMNLLLSECQNVIPEKIGY